MKYFLIIFLLILSSFQNFKSTNGNTYKVYTTSETYTQTEVNNLLKNYVKLIDYTNYKTETTNTLNLLKIDVALLKQDNVLLKKQVDSLIKDSVFVQLPLYADKDTLKVK